MRCFTVKENHVCGYRDPSLQTKNVMDYRQYVSLSTLVEYMKVDVKNSQPAILDFVYGYYLFLLRDLKG